MIIIVPFRPCDGHLIAPQAAQADMVARNGGADNLQAMAEKGLAWTGIETEPPYRVVFVGGIAWCDDGYATCWSVLADDVGGAGMLALTRRARREVNDAMKRARRIDMIVAARHAEGQRWAGLLGFGWQPEARLAAAMADGDDALIYSRLKGRDNG